MDVLAFFIHYLGVATAIAYGSGILFVIVTFLSGDARDRRERADDYNPDE